jgi:hypothetical protein
MKSKQHVISFRLGSADFKDSKERLELNPIVGVKSPSQFSRKIVEDFLAGRLAYANPEDATKNFSLEAEEEQPAAQAK